MIKEYRISEKKERFIITFPFDWNTLSDVKSLSSRKYHPKEKFWTVPVSKKIAKELYDIGFAPHQSVLDFFEKNKEKEANSIIETKKSLKKYNIHDELYPFQREGIAKIQASDGKILLADEMGLGKTIQALTWLKINPTIRPVLIVVPATLKLNWAKEIRKWLYGEHYQILQGQNPDTELKRKIIIINYDILPYWQEKLKNHGFKVMINDECHKFKSNKALRTKAVKQIAKTIPHIINISGTPIVNRPIEMYNAIHMINSNLFPSRWNFGQKYCNLKHNGFGLDWNGSSNVEELHKILVDSIMIRRKKKDVLKDLPDKNYNYVPFESQNKEEYNKAENDLINYLREEKGKEKAIRASNAEKLVKVEVLKQLAVKGKIKNCIKWIEDFLESGEKLVLFAVHKKTIEQLMNVFGNVAVRMDGGSSQKDKQTAITEFQNNSNIRLFISNIQTGGVGITLTAASNVAIIELPWTPGEISQAVDRVHRIGQENAVNVYFLLCEKTIEEKIVELLEKKQKILDRLIDGVKEKDNQSVLTELMNCFK